MLISAVIALQYRHSVSSEAQYTGYHYQCDSTRAHRWSSIDHLTFNICGLPFVFFGANMSIRFLLSSWLQRCACIRNISNEQMSDCLRLAIVTIVCVVLCVVSNIGFHCQFFILNIYLFIYFVFVRRYLLCGCLLFVV